MSMKQKDAVFQALETARGQGLEGDQAREFAVRMIATGLMNGSVSHSKGQLDEKRAVSYAGSLVSNWTKKDTRLTNGVKYVPENRTGPRVKDETLKKLTAALKSLEVNNPENIELIERTKSAIATRKEQITTAKASAKAISIDEALASLAELGIEVA
jgi:2-oxoglutarate dehydrogenase complex dehydrogenase (E1) component-like enzyme